MLWMMLMLGLLSIINIVIFSITLTDMFYVTNWQNKLLVDTTSNAELSIITLQHYDALCLLKQPVADESFPYDAVWWQQTFVCNQKRTKVNIDYIIEPIRELACAKTNAQFTGGKLFRITLRGNFHNTFITTLEQAYVIWPYHTHAHCLSKPYLVTSPQQTYQQLL